MHLEWSQNSRYGSRKYIYIISIDNLTTVNRLSWPESPCTIGSYSKGQSAFSVRETLSECWGQTSCSEKHYGFRPLNQKQPHCLINTESTFLNMRAQRPIWPEGESTLKHVGRDETALPFWLFGLYLVLYKAAFQSSTLDSTTQRREGKIHNI